MVKQSKSRQLIRNALWLSVVLCLCDRCEACKWSFRRHSNANCMTSRSGASGCARASLGSRTVRRASPPQGPDGAPALADKTKSSPNDAGRLIGPTLTPTGDLVGRIVWLQSAAAVAENAPAANDSKGLGDQETSPPTTNGISGAFYVAAAQFSKSPDGLRRPIRVSKQNGAIVDARPIGQRSHSAKASCRLRRCASKPGAALNSRMTRRITS